SAVASRSGAGGRPSANQERVWQSDRPASASGTRGARRQAMLASAPSATTRRGAKRDIGAIAGAKRRALPEFIPPELATLVSAAPEGDSWLHEIKYDGFRILCRVEKGAVRLLTRSGQDWTE